MREIRKAVRLNKTEYYETHLSLINCVLPKPVRMTPMEIKVMAAFMSLDGDLAKYRFGPTAKKIVMKNVNPEKPLSPAGLSNYIVSLVNKEILIKTGDIIEIHPLLLLDGNEQLYKFKLLNIGNDKT